MRIAITGSSGLLGSALVASLRSLGHEIVPIVRRTAHSGEIKWDPQHGTINKDELNGLDTVVHLAGAGVGDHRWSASYKDAIRSSRVKGTETLSNALAVISNPPAVMLSASAVGYYGIRGDEELTEASEPGTGFLADVCARWEAAAVPADMAGVRVVPFRMGVVLSSAGGALKKQLIPFKIGLGARLGTGTQQFSWITRRDAVAAICFLIEHHEMAGPVNVTAPHPVSNREFTQALGRALHRPAGLAVPAAVLRAVVGTEMATEFLLSSQRAIPRRLLEAGFKFADPELPGALTTALSDRALVPDS